MSVITKVLGRIQLRGASTPEATSKNETLLDRELFIEKNVGIKIGDGTRQYNNLPYLAKFGGGDSVGLGGTNYVFVKGDGTPTENYAELIAAYTTAKGMSPSVNKIITVVISPGTYEGADITFDTDYIDITSLTGQPDVIIPSVLTFSQSKVTGIDSSNWEVEGSFKSNGTTFINCVGGSDSFWDSSGKSMQCYDCVGGDNSFIISNTTSTDTKDRFYRCLSGTDSFYVSSKTRAEFHDCIGTDACFKDSSPNNPDYAASFFKCIAEGESFILTNTGAFAYNCHTIRGEADSSLTSTNSVFCSSNKIPIV